MDNPCASSCPERERRRPPAGQACRRRVDPDRRSAAFGEVVHAVVVHGDRSRGPYVLWPAKGCCRGSRRGRPALKLQGHPPSRLQPPVPFRLGQLRQRFHLPIERRQVAALLPQQPVERRPQPVVSVHVVQVRVVQRTAEPALVVRASTPRWPSGFRSRAGAGRGWPASARNPAISSPGNDTTSRDDFVVVPAARNSAVSWSCAPVTRRVNSALRRRCAAYSFTPAAPWFASTQFPQHEVEHCAPLPGRGPS